MTHEELLVKIDGAMRDAESDLWLIHSDRCCGDCTCKEEEAKVTSPHKALRAVVELHKPDGGLCNHCEEGFIMGSIPVVYPCPTIQAIEKELA